MNLAHLIAVLRSRWIVALSVFVLVATGFIVYTLTQPRTYTATASLVIDAKADPVSEMFGGGINPAMLNTQIDIIRSDRVAQRVIRNLKLTEMADLRVDWEKGAKNEGGLTDWLTTVLEAGLVADVARPGSNVLNIGYRGRDPRFVAAVANAYMQAYLETSIELRVDPAKQYSGFFSDQVKDARDTLEKAQARLSAFQREKGIISSDERMDTETNRLNMLTQELVSVQAQNAETSSRQAQARQNANQISDVLNSGTVGSLKSELARADAHLQELSARYGDNHPEVQSARAQVNDIRQRLATETRNVVGSVGVGANINRAREGELRAQIETQRATILRMKALHDESSVLARDVQNAQQAYDLVLNRYNQTNLESRNTQSNATIISQATPPSLPSSPKIVANITMGVAVALALALAAALGLEQLDKRLRTPADAVTALGLPVIGIMPLPTMNRRVRTQIAQSQTRVISGRRGLPAPDGSTK